MTRPGIAELIDEAQQQLKELASDVSVQHWASSLRTAKDVAKVTGQILHRLTAIADLQQELGFEDLAKRQYPLEDK